MDPVRLALDLLCLLESRGYSFRVADGRLLVKPQLSLVEVALVQEHHASLVALVEALPTARLRELAAEPAPVFGDQKQKPQSGREHWTHEEDPES